MTESDYLNLVKVYLSQELPGIFKTTIAVTDGAIRLTLPADSIFDKEFSELKMLIIESVERIRVKEYDMNFSTWASTGDESRDFTINK